MTSLDVDASFKIRVRQGNECIRTLNPSILPVTNRLLKPLIFKLSGNANLMIFDRHFLSSPRRLLIS